MSSPTAAPATHQHPHPHEAPHTHSHVAGTGHVSGEVYGPSHQGSVMVDIGGDVGALIVHTPATLLGAEIELSHVDDADTRTHVAVRERRGPGPVQYAAVFPSLTAGTYTLWHPDRHGSPAAQVTVNGAEVTRFTWPS